MRKVLPSTFALLLTSSPAVAAAGDHGPHGGHEGHAHGKHDDDDHDGDDQGKHKHKGKHKGKHKHKGKSKGKGKGKGNQVAKVEGAGQRPGFSFGGKVSIRKGKAYGHFMILAVPMSPTGSTLSVECKFFTFANATITDNRATFDGNGKCVRLTTAGELENFDAHNQFQIVDGDGGDSIDVNFVGSSGIAIPGGALSFGDFTFSAGD